MARLSVAHFELGRVLGLPGLGLGLGSGLAVRVRVGVRVGVRGRVLGRLHEAAPHLLELALRRVSW